MKTRHHPLLSMAALLLTLAPCHAGPCSKQIEEFQIQIDAKLNAAAANGPAADETTAATDHRQPTPKSIAAAEVKLGDVSQKVVRAVADALASARKADLAGDRTGCDRALAAAQRALTNE
jgi:hypothetical protein